ncbi:DUF805 domain-containing protein [Rhizobium sp. MC63]|uniref:DUF805 domain-containing protein n=1 Tax=Rhizobium mulingense TaxID=3031128 RepID=A0ACC6MS15_9HYPH|nr:MULTISPECIES: DUF805 domain-containing protein [unclassified Rhizobium]MDF0696179.1 DUF805 domain-containing protein [Rhizobium sp. MC63]MEA3516000.1 DUF805 domain-containing protein [Rhizobium sp. MJ31]
MGFTEAVRTVLTQKYATFSGRASRSEYWWFFLFYMLLAIAIAVLAFVVGSFSRQQGEVVILVMVMGGLLALALVLPILSLQVRRFHDRNISGWWYLALIILGMVPYIGPVTSLSITIISVLRGTEGPNKFGPDPLRPEARAEVFA